MDLTKVPEPYRTRIADELKQNNFSDEIQQLIIQTVENQPWEEAKNNIFNGLEYIQSEARKAQNWFCK